MKRLVPVLGVLGAGCGSDVSVGTTKVVHHYEEVIVEVPVETDLSEEAPDDSTDATEDLPYIVDDPRSDDTPLATVEEIELALEEALAMVMRTDPAEAFPVILNAMASGDGYCPYYYDTYAALYGYDYWYGGCVTADGDRHEGTVYGKDDLPYDSAYYDVHRYSWWQSDYGIQMADGQRFDMTGYLYTWDSTYISTGERIVYLTTRGFSLVWQGGAWDDTWMGSQRSFDYVATARQTAAGDVYLDIDGSLSTGDGRIEAILFDDVFLHTAGYGATCEAEPSGTISVRLDDGRWYDVLFDGAAYPGASVFPPDCDGCGEVWSRGESLGRVCPDLTVLYDWEGRPWD